MCACMYTPWSIRKSVLGSWTGVQHCALCIYFCGCTILSKLIIHYIQARAPCQHLNLICRSLCCCVRECCSLVLCIICRRHGGCRRCAILPGWVVQSMIQQATLCACSKHCGLLRKFCILAQSTPSWWDIPHALLYAWDLQPGIQHSRLVCLTEPCL